MSMTDAEAEQLWKRYRAQGATSDREQLILHYAPLVRRVVSRLGILSSPTMEYHDMVSHGISGLIEAVDRFDPGRGISFTAYATQRIRGSVLDALRKLDHLSRSVRHQSAEIERAIATLRARSGEIPSDEQVAEYLGTNIENFRQVLDQANIVFLSLDSPFTDFNASDENLTLSEALEDPSVHDIMEEIEERDLRRELSNAIRELPEREQLVLSLYYNEELTIREVAEVLSLSPSRISQLLSKAIMTLRARLLYGQSQTVERRDSRTRLPAARATVAGLLIILALFVFGATSVVANGAPVDLYLGYLPGESNWGPENVTGHAVVAVGEAEVQLEVEGLPVVADEHYQAWLESRAGREWYQAGSFNVGSNGVGQLHLFLDNLPYQEYRMLLITSEPDPGPSTQPGEHRSVGAYFPNPAAAHTTATPVASGASTGTVTGTPANTGSPAGVTTHLPVTGGAAKKLPLVWLGLLGLVSMTSLGAWVAYRGRDLR